MTTVELNLDVRGARPRVLGLRDALRPSATSADRIDYRVPANGRLVLTWE